MVEPAVKPCAAKWQAQEMFPVRSDVVRARIVVLPGMQWYP